MPGRRMRTLALLLAAAGAELSLGRVEAASWPARRNVARRALRLDDGDTLTVGERSVRVLGIDCPETAHPEHGLVRDQPRGPEAAALAARLLAGARRVELLELGDDCYGRRLAHVLVDGELLARKLIEAGLAYASDDGEDDPCARALRAAAERAPPPSFVHPSRWRRAERARAPRHAP